VEGDDYTSNDYTSNDNTSNDNTSNDNTSNDGSSDYGQQFYAVGDAAAETTTTTAAEVGTEAAVGVDPILPPPPPPGTPPMDPIPPLDPLPELVVAEEGAMSIPVVGLAIAGGIAAGVVVGEGLWELDKAISNRPHSEAADDENNPLLSEEDKELMRRHTEGG
jgi:hypothetical protein